MQSGKNIDQIENQWKKIKKLLFLQIDEHLFKEQGEMKKLITKIRKQRCHCWLYANE